MSCESVRLIYDDHHGCRACESVTGGCHGECRLAIEHTIQLQQVLLRLAGAYLLMRAVLNPIGFLVAPGKVGRAASLVLMLYLAAYRAKELWRNGSIALPGLSSSLLPDPCPSQDALKHWFILQSSSGLVPLTRQLRRARVHWGASIAACIHSVNKSPAPLHATARRSSLTQSRGRRERSAARQAIFSNGDDVKE